MLKTKITDIPRPDVDSHDVIKETSLNSDQEHRGTGGFGEE